MRPVALPSATAPSAAARPLYAGSARCHRRKIGRRCHPWRVGGVERSPPWEERGLQHFRRRLLLGVPFVWKTFFPGMEHYHPPRDTCEAYPRVIWLSGRAPLFAHRSVVRASPVEFLYILFTYFGGKLEFSTTSFFPFIFRQTTLFPPPLFVNTIFPPRGFLGCPRFFLFSSHSSG